MNTQTHDNPNSPLVKAPDFPHREWEYLGCEDRRIPNNLCQYCGKRHVRYVHELSHADWPNLLEAGGVCADKLLGSEEAQSWEREAKLRTQRKKSFMAGEWKVTRYGGKMKTHRSRRVVVAAKFGRWCVWIDSEKWEGSFATEDEAKSLAFDIIDKCIKTRIRIHRRSLGLN